MTPFFILLKRIFLLVTNPIVKKYEAIVKNLAHIDRQVLWDKYFQGNNQITYDLSNGTKIRLDRQNRLTGFIIFQNFEQSELEFINSYLVAGETFLDIGANIGLHTIYAALKVGEHGTVHSFEPSKSTYFKLVENVSLNKFKNVHAYNIGLSNKKEKLMLKTSVQYDAWNTFTSGDISSDELYDDVQEVEVDILDEWILTQSDEKQSVSLVKIDVEGWEKFVLMGAHRLLSRNDAPTIIIEFDDSNTWKAGYRAFELYRLLIEYGYTITKYDLQTRRLIKEMEQLNYPSQNLIAVKDLMAANSRLL